MSGGAIEQAMDAVKRGHEADVAAEAQLSLLDPVTPEEMAEAREDLGQNAGQLTVLRHARVQRRGRPPGAKNKRTDDFAKYLMQFGQDPMIGAMQLANTAPEVLVENSRREFIKIVGTGAKRKRHVWTAPTMTYGDALSHIARARELLAPYLHGKKPVTISHDFSNLKDLVIEGLTHSREEVEDIVEADFLEIEDMRSDGGEE